jgi:alkanesulfonate monooxygenase SsuD/methylene tetrahydromethanopterin reductase-like flavin-dependent oxidoreductase (luciferase family)
VQYGLCLPTGGECGDARFLVELGTLAEACGWEGVFLEDYVCYQGDATAPSCNTWVALAGIAARTERVRLGTEVTPLARRRPWNVAREAAAIDQLSGGRVILGVGLGDTGEAIGVDASFARFGEELDARRRAGLLDEGLEIVAGLWTGEPFSFHGEHFTVEEVTFLPTPVQEPRIPIWIGGGYPNPRPLRRALRWDGCCFYRETHGGPWEDMSPEDVRALRDAAGGRPFTIAVGGAGRRDDWEAERDHIRAVAEAGAAGGSSGCSLPTATRCGRPSSSARCSSDGRGGDRRRRRRPRAAGSPAGGTRARRLAAGRPR